MSAPITQRGKASIHGVDGSADVIVYPITQKLRMTQQFEEEVGKDTQGGDAWWIARNEHGMLNIGVKFVADTAAHAATPSATGSNILSTLSQPFLAPYATVTLTGFALTGLNGVYQNLTGCELDMDNTKVADGDFKLRRYADSTQNTLANTTPA